MAENRKSQQYKTKSQLVKEAKERNLAAEIDNDVKKFDDAIKRPETLKKQGNPRELDQEQEVSDLVKRVMLLAATCDLQIKDENGNFISAGGPDQDPLPLASYLSHGGRINVIGASQELMNWIATGDPEKSDGVSMKETQQEALEEGNLLYYRPAATHAVETKPSRNKDGTMKQDAAGNQEYEYIEKKGFKIGAKSFLEDRILGKQSNHRGADLAMNIDAEGYDPEGNKVDGPDGDHGHLYINFKKEKDGKKGTMLIGVEGAAPTSDKHSKFGTPDPLSAVGSGKWSDVQEKQEQAPEGAKYKNTPIPKDFGSARIEMDEAKEKALYELWNEMKGEKAEKYNDIAKAKPAENVEEFKKNYASGSNFHEYSTSLSNAPTEKYRQEANKENQSKTFSGIAEKKLGSIRQSVTGKIEIAKRKSKPLAKKSEHVISNASKSIKGKMEIAERKSKPLAQKSEHVISNASKRIKGKMQEVNTNATKVKDKTSKNSKELIDSATKKIKQNKNLKSLKKAASPKRKKQKQATSLGK